MATKNKKKYSEQIDPYFVIGLYEHGMNALGGPLNGQGNPPANDPYNDQLKEYNQSLQDLKSPHKGALIDPAQNPELYKISRTGLKPKKVYKSTAGDNLYFTEYDIPTKQTPQQVPTPAAPKQPRYLDPYTRQPLDSDIYGVPDGTEDVQFTQGIELESRKLSNLKAQQDQQAVMDNNRKLISSMSPEQLAEMRSLKLTPSEYLARNGQAIVQEFAYGGSIELADEQTLQGTVPQYSHVNVKGETTKGAMSGALTGAATGASMGSVIPGWGTAVGAVVGAVAGGITGGIKKKKAAEAMQEQDQMMYDESNAIYQANDDEDQAVYRALGGPLTVGNIEGPRHEEGGVSMGGAETEGGEAKVGNYIFSDRLKPKGSKRTFAQHAKTIEFKYRDRENDYPALRSKAKELESLQVQNDMVRAEVEHQERMMENQLEAEAFAYGGRLRYENGGVMYNPEDKVLFSNLAKQKNMKVDDYVKRIYANGGNLDGGPPYDNSIVSVDNDLNSDLEQDPEFLNYLKSSLSTGDNDYYTSENYTPEDDYSDEQSPVDKTKKFNFDNEEAALLASSVGSVDNLIAAADNSRTNFNRVTPSLISLNNQRENIDSDIAMARQIGRENVRGNATSSGQALSNLAAMNASLTQQQQRALGESYANEANANSQIINQNRGINAQIANEEVLANEQNKDIRRSVQNQALTDIGGNTQMYLRDKKLTEENKRQNERVVDVINSLGYNYKWTDDNGELALQFMSLLNNKKKNG